MRNRDQYNSKYEFNIHTNEYLDIKNQGTTVTVQNIPENALDDYDVRFDDILILIEVNSQGRTGKMLARTVTSFQKLLSQDPDIYKYTLVIGFE